MEKMPNPQYVSPFLNGPDRDQFADVKATARTVALDEQLDAEYLATLSLDELRTFKEVLFARAVDVICEIGELTETDPFVKQAYQRRLLEATYKDPTGNFGLISRLDRKFQYKNMFAPGPWFKEHLDKLEDLRRQHAENVATFPQREADRLRAEMLGQGTRQQQQLRRAA